MAQQEIRLLDPQQETWSAEIDRLRRILGAPHNPLLLPPQFLHVTLPKIGGQVVAFKDQQRLLGVGFLFPRRLQNDRPSYTLRFHPLQASFDPQRWLAPLQQRLGAAEIVPYDPRQQQPYQATRAFTDSSGIEIGRPNAQEARAIRDLQRQIWGCSEDLLYPTDLHATSFSLGSSLVARRDGQVVGLLFGFYKFGGAPLPSGWSNPTRSTWRIESQLLATRPAYRGQGIAFLLKQIQAEQALAEGISLINWTVDPLQWANAVLNFGKLGALACRFQPDYYPVRNVLNRVPASRLEISWIVDSDRVRQILEQNDHRSPVVDIEGNAAIHRLDAEGQREALTPSAATVALEIPTHWTDLQQNAPQQAARWRQRTDRILQTIVGHEVGRYAITSVGQKDERRYLIAERIDPPPSPRPERARGQKKESL